MGLISDSVVAAAIKANAANDYWVAGLLIIVRKAVGADRFRELVRQADAAELVGREGFEPPA